MRRMGQHRTLQRLEFTVLRQQILDDLPLHDHVERQMRIRLHRRRFVLK